MEARARPDPVVKQHGSQLNAVTAVESHPRLGSWNQRAGHPDRVRERKRLGGRLPGSGALLPARTPGQLFDVAADGANDVWAVGTSIQHWTGTTYVQVKAPATTSGRGRLLTSVSMVGKTVFVATDPQNAVYKRASGAWQKVFGNPGFDSAARTLVDGVLGVGRHERILPTIETLVSGRVLGRLVVAGALTWT